MTFEYLHNIKREKTRILFLLQVALFSFSIDITSNLVTSTISIIMFFIIS